MTLRIGDVADRAAISVATIRYYESRGLLPPAPRQAGRRCYDETVVARLDVIRALKTAGFPLDDIRRLLVEDAGVDGSRRALVDNRLRDVRRTIVQLKAIERALVAAIDCACTSLEDCDRLPHADGT